MHLDVPERLVVSPAAGVYLAPAHPVVDVEAGHPIGFVRVGPELVPVTSPFTGRILGVDAVDGERIQRHQRIGWLRLTASGSNGTPAAA